MVATRAIFSFTNLYFNCFETKNLCDGFRTIKTQIYANHGLFSAHIRSFQLTISALFSQLRIDFLVKNLLRSKFEVQHMTHNPLGKRVRVCWSLMLRACAFAIGLRL
jgi:hypothetical protein